MLKKCVLCKKYTLKNRCSCGGEAVDAHPFKFSLEKERKYGKYRQQAKTQ
ncbi:MAG: nucleolar RNA-binding Nop10p family protein [Candidatus Aenigmarchaeota archaeon]|nr:nucleolar RNA-binding Nop10p family protein [Candidatus Aenigmarchaeota archaeon]